MLSRQTLLDAEEEAVDHLLGQLTLVNLLEDAAAFYPEYTFSAPYGVWTGHLPLYAVLPFYRQLIVHVDPFEAPRTFQRAYGMSVREMAELRDRGRLVLMLRAEYRRYPAFYDALLGNHIPLNNRVERAYLASRNADTMSYYDILQRRFHRRRSACPKTLERRLSGKVGAKNAWKFALNTMAQRLAKLSLIGLEESAMEIVRERTFLAAYDALHAYNRALAVPLIDALGGWDNLDAEHLEMLKDIPTGPEESQIVLPRDMLYWLNNTIGYRYPRDVLSGTDYVDAVEEADVAAENHKTLLAMRKAFDRSDFNASFESAEKSKSLCAEWGKHISRIEKTRRSFRRWITSPLNFACTAVSTVAFSLAATELASGDKAAFVTSGLAGVGTLTMQSQIRTIERFLASLQHGITSVPTILWNQMAKKKEKKTI